jgi:hypothetical protein
MSTGDHKVMSLIGIHWGTPDDPERAVTEACEFARQLHRVGYNRVLAVGRSVKGGTPILHFKVCRGSARNRDPPRRYG